ncbi:MAG: hypothetical protein ACOVLE_08345, partial [Pirellula staleyi]
KAAAKIDGLEVRRTKNHTTGTMDFQSAVQNGHSPQKHALSIGEVAPEVRRLPPCYGLDVRRTIVEVRRLGGI